MLTCKYHSPAHVPSSSNAAELAEDTKQRKKRNEDLLQTTRISVKNSQNISSRANEDFREGSYESDSHYAVRQNTKKASPFHRNLFSNVISTLLAVPPVLTIRGLYEAQEHPQSMLSLAVFCANKAFTIKQAHTAWRRVSSFLRCFADFR